MMAYDAFTKRVIRLNKQIHKWLAPFMMLYCKHPPKKIKRTVVVNGPLIVLKP